MRTCTFSFGFLAAFILAMLSLHTNAQSWKLTGNSGINPDKHFVGTKDEQPLIFKTNDAERIRILKTGKIGIGTKKPEAILNIISPDYVTLSTPGNLMLGDVKGSNMALDVNVIQARFNGGASSLYLNYYGGNTYLGPYGAVAVSSSGYMTTSLLGINGTYSSSYALNVTPYYNGINITDGGNGYAINSTKSGSFAGVYAVKTTSGSVDACVWGNASGSARGLEGSSYSGVGVYGSSSTNYAGYFSGNVYCTGSYQPSDLTLKKDVKDFAGAMNIINQIHPKIYQYKDDGDYRLMNLPQGNRYGLIAEEVEKVLPGLVKQSKFEKGHDADAKGKAPEVINFKAVNYTELIPILIKGVQEQQMIIDNQQQQINELKEMVEKLAGNSASLKSASEINGGYLKQNAPNPFTQSTVISTYIPENVQQAKLFIYNMQGRQLLAYHLQNKGANNVTITSGSLPAGQYIYTLFLDGKIKDSKNMILTK